MAKHFTSRAWRSALLGVMTSTVFACGGDGIDPQPKSARVPDAAPLARMTNEQYNNTIRDLFAPAAVTPVVFPLQIQGVGGFENNASFNTASAPLVETYQRAGLSVSAEVIAQIDSLIPCEHGERSCGHQFLDDLAERAWRRPLTAEETATMHADFDSWMDGRGWDAAMQLSIQVLLQAPDFMYFPSFGGAGELSEGEGVPLSSWEVAARLSYFLWNSMPDDELFALARQDGLQSREAVAEQAWRLLADWRARESVVNFHRQLLSFDEIGSVGPDFEFYADALSEFGEAEDDIADWYFLEYTPGVRYEPEVFVSQHIFEGEGTLAALLTSTTAWTTPDIARLAYQTSVDEEAEPIEWRALNILSQFSGEQDEPYFSYEYYPIELDSRRRAGLLTMAGFLTSHANAQQPSPVGRGVAVLERLLCRELVPPGDVPPLEESTLGAEPKTNRERYEIHKQSEACAGCHRPIDGIGMTFENYDTLGRWRDQDNGFPVDASGELVGTDMDGNINNALELVDKLAASRDVHDCYVKQWYRYAFGRNEDNATDLGALKNLQEGFWGAGGDIPELLVNIAASHQFRHRTPHEGGAS